jgi:glutaredoxin 2
MLKWFKSLFKDNPNSLTNLLLLQREEHQKRIMAVESENKKLKAELLILGSESAMANEIRILNTIIESSSSVIDEVSTAEIRVAELERRLNNLQGKYDSKVARYKKIITKLESKNEAK